MESKWLLFGLVTACCLVQTIQTPVMQIEERVSIMDLVRGGSFSLVTNITGAVTRRDFLDAALIALESLNVQGLAGLIVYVVSFIIRGVNPAVQAWFEIPNREGEVPEIMGITQLKALVSTILGLLY